MKLAHTIVLGAVVTLLSPIASARGVSPYLPLNLSPALERQIERVLLLAGKPVMRRPIPTAVVLDALPIACELDRATCAQVRSYLQSYMGTWGLTSLQLQVAGATGDSASALPNAHGESVDSPWRVSASGYYQPSNHLLISAGGIAYDGNATPTGSLVSLGWDFAQLDIGFRDHWLSPLTDSSSTISTEAPTMPSVTLSNYRPISPLGVNYEVFYSEMSHQDDILYVGMTTEGRPRLAGMQIGFEPVPGYALAGTRITQYGGGARNRSVLSQFFDVLLHSNNDPMVAGEALESGNRVASLASAAIFPGKVPFAVRVEYSGEDNAHEGSYRLGATNLSLGLDFPDLWRVFDLTYEVSEWQNDWYTHHLYPRGLTNRGHVIGHWFGDHRVFGDAIGGSSHMLRAGWRLGSGDYLQATYRTMSLDEDWRGVVAPRVDYDRLQSLGVRYSTAWRGHAIEGELSVGRDVFGDSFARLSASFDVAPVTWPRAPEEFGGDRSTTATDVFVDIGAQRSEVREVMYDLGPNVMSGPGIGYHVGVGARRRVSTRNDLGVRIEFDDIEGVDVLSVRAVDYRFRFTRRFAFGAFFGAARYQVQLPAYGYYGGIGLQYRDVLPRWDIGLDYRYHEKLTRDKVLPSDPPVTEQLPRRAFDVKGFSLYLSRRW